MEIPAAPVEDETSPPGQLRFPFPEPPLRVLSDEEEDREEAAAFDDLDSDADEGDPGWRETCGRCGLPAERIGTQAHGGVWGCPDPACGERWARGLEI